MSCSASSPKARAAATGTLYKGRTGAARLAMKIGCPIFPVGVVGTDEIQPPDAKAPKLFAGVLDQDRPTDHVPSGTGTVVPSTSPGAR